MAKKIRKVNLAETIISVYESVNWNPLTITMPQNGDQVTLTPEFYSEDVQDKSTFKSLKVTGSCMPISGSLGYVVDQLRHYERLIELRRNIDSTFNGKMETPVVAPAYAVVS